MTCREWVEGFGAEVALDVAAAHKAGCRVEISFIGLSALAEVSCVVGHAQPFGHTCHCIVGHRIFKTFGHRFVAAGAVVWYIAVLLESGERTLVEHARSLHCLVCRQSIGYVTFQQQVGQHNHAGVAYHAFCFVAVQMPHRQFALLIEYVYESSGIGRLQLRMYKC